MDVVTKGLLFGLTLAILLGPVFFALIQTSIHSGFKSGAAMALGISLSDLFYIVISYIGITQLLQNDSLQTFLSIAGGGIMLAFGISSFRKPVLEKNSQNCTVASSLWRFTLKGFLLNGINPFVLLFWIAVVSYSSVEYEFTGHQAQLFFGAIILTVFVTDLIKAYMSHRLRSLITEKYISILNKVVGVAMLVFAIRLFYSGLAIVVLPF